MKQKSTPHSLVKLSHLAILTGLLLVITTPALAQTDLTLGKIASNIVKTFEGLTLAITGASYIAGLGFSIGAILKFKQHKDNPTQIPIGTPVAMLFISSALLFMPTLLGVTGNTMFGAGQAKTAGPTGTLFKGAE